VEVHALHAACDTVEELVVHLAVGLAMNELGTEENRCIAGASAVQRQFPMHTNGNVYVGQIEGLIK